MADLIVTNNLNTGTGSLRNVIAAANDGDNIIFDTTAFPINQETTISLETTITLVAHNITIDGGETWTEGGVKKTRVIVDAQSLARCLTSPSNAAGCVVTLKNITLANGHTSGSSYGGCVVCQNNAIATFNGVIFSDGSSARGGGATTRVNAQSAFINCEFRNCSATSYGAALYFDASVSLTINNCTFTATTDATNIYINTTTGTLIISGLNVVDKIGLISGSNVNFSGVDSVLAVTTTATIGSSTFTTAADSTGYFATPTGTDISSATFSGVVPCTYGAGLLTFDVDEEGATWTASSIATPILIEKQNGSAWTVLTANASGGSYATTFAEGDVARAFDGVQFIQATVPGPPPPPPPEEVYWTVKCWSVPTNGGGDAGGTVPSWCVVDKTITPNVVEL